MGAVVVVDDDAGVVLDGVAEGEGEEGGSD